MGPAHLLGNIGHLRCVRGAQSAQLGAVRLARRRGVGACARRCTREGGAALVSAIVRRPTRHGRVAHPTAQRMGDASPMRCASPNRAAHG